MKPPPNNFMVEPTAQLSLEVLEAIAESCRKNNSNNL
jgi:hypothetical protein